MTLLLGLARALPAVWVAAPLAWPARLVLAGLLTAAAWPALPPAATMTGSVFHELLVGVALGVTASVPFRAAQAAGATLGRAAGATGLGDGLGLFALALFGAAGGPLQVARAWGETYVALPVDAQRLGVEAGARLVGTAISLALPGLGALLAAELLAGLLVKAQPQLMTGGGGGALRLAVALLAIAAGVSAITTVLAGAGLGAPLR